MCIEATVKLSGRDFICLVERSRQQTVSKQTEGGFQVERRAMK